MHFNVGLGLVNYFQQSLGNFLIVCFDCCTQLVCAVLRNIIYIKCIDISIILHTPLAPAWIFSWWVKRDPPREGFSRGSPRRRSEGAEPRDAREVSNLWKNRWEICNFNYFDGKCAIFQCFSNFVENFAKTRAKI